MGPDWNPERFSVEDVNRRLRETLPDSSTMATATEANSLSLRQVRDGNLGIGAPALFCYTSAVPKEPNDVSTTSTDFA